LFDFVSSIVVFCFWCFHSIWWCPLAVSMITIVMVHWCSIWRKKSDDWKTTVDWRIVKNGRIWKKSGWWMWRPDCSGMFNQSSQVDSVLAWVLLLPYSDMVSCCCWSESCSAWLMLLVRLHPILKPHSS
jgi:hypothetical protein